MNNLLNGLRSGQRDSSSADLQLEGDGGTCRKSEANLAKISSEDSPDATLVSQTKDVPSCSPKSSRAGPKGSFPGLTLSLQYISNLASKGKVEERTTAVDNESIFRYVAHDSRRKRVVVSHNEHWEHVDHDHEEGAGR